MHVSPSQHATRAVVDVISQDRDFLRGLNELLRQHSLEIRLHHNAEKFLQLVAKGVARCLLIEARSGNHETLPELEGLNLVRHLSLHAPHISVVVVTDENDIQTAVKALQAHARDVVEKGFFTGHTMQRIRQFATQETATHSLPIH